MRRIHGFLFCAILWPPLLVQGQITGALSGTVRATDGAPLSSAAVTATSADSTYSTTSDESGAFRFRPLPTDIYSIGASHVGYRPIAVSEAWVRAGKEEVIDLRMESTVTELVPMEVRAFAPSRLDAIGTDRLTVERSLRYPATFFDPARVAMSYAGVASVNDQANHMSVRGNDPGSNAWLLEGAEIVTPNHLTNAGTASDLPTLTGGGTTILSAQMLAPSRLVTGSMAASYGNALGGIMDLRLRRGSHEGQAYTAQAGLLGIDLSTEGPFTSGGKASYLVNYRYSTLGLLSAMGVELGEEAITFQDLAFTVSLPAGARTDVLLFGMGGMSANLFTAKDSAEWEFDKDSQDIEYRARMGAAGVLIERRFGAQAVWSTTVALSSNDQQRTEVYALSTDRDASIARDALRESKASVNSSLRLTLTARTTVQLGAQAMDRLVRKEISWLSESTDGWLVRPFARMEHRFSERVRMDLGMAYAHWTAGASGVPEPRISLQVATGAHGRIILATGQRSQLPRIQNYAVQRLWPGGGEPVTIDNTGIGLTRSVDLDARYEHSFGPKLRGTAALFRQHLIGVPAQAGYSLLNEWDGVYPLTLLELGEALNQGGSLSLERDMVNGLYFLANATLFRSSYWFDDEEDHDSRWDTRHIVNATIGKEYARQKEPVKRVWGLNLRASGMGGQRFTPVPTAAEPNPAEYSARYSGVFRLDVRVYLKRERTGRTGMWALDLLNATDARNEAFQYFDTRKGELVTRYQLGLIPNLSYRIEF